MKYYKQLLSLFLVRSKLSNRRLSGLIGLSFQSLNNWLGDSEIEPSYKYLLLISKFFKVPAFILNIDTVDRSQREELALIVSMLPDDEVDRLISVLSAAYPSPDKLLSNQVDSVVDNLPMS